MSKKLACMSLLMASIWGLSVGCGGEHITEGESAHSSPLAGQDHLIAPFVAWLRELGDPTEEEEQKRLLTLARSLKPEPEGRAGRDAFASLARDLVAMRYVNGVRHLDSVLHDEPDGAEKRWELHRALVDMYRATVGTLRGLATRDPESVLLAPFRPGGIEYLLEVAEGTKSAATPRDRVISVSLLGDFGDASVLPRLKLLQDNRTVFSWPGHDRDYIVLGEVVREAVERLEERRQK